MMSPVSSTKNELRCAQCGARLRAGAADCWLCHARFDPHAAGETAAEAAPKSQVSERGFSLATLLMTMTLIAVVLGTFSVSPGVGILTIIALAPAALRTAWVVQQRKVRGEATTIGEKAAVFGASLGMVVVSGVAAAIAFGAPCWGGFVASSAFAGPEDYGFHLLGAVIGGLIGAILGLWVFSRVQKLLAPKDVVKPSPWLFIAALCSLLIAALLLWFFTESML